MNNEGVGHAFVYGDKAKGSSFSSEHLSNAGGKADTALYSYSSLLALRFAGDNLIVINTPIANYSNTSQRHALHLRRAISSEWNVLYVTGLDIYTKLKDICNEEQLKNVNLQIIEYYKKQKRARKYDYSSVIKDKINQGNLILTYGNIRKNSKILKQFEEIASDTDLDELIENALKVEKAEKAKSAKNKAKRNLERLETFKGEKLKGYTNLELNECSFLRIDGDIVRTSNSSNVPLKDAKLLYIAYKKGLKLIGQKIGYYTVIKQDKKYLQIGCNKLIFKDIENTLKGA